MKKHKVGILYGIWAVMYVGAVLLSLLDNVQGSGLVLVNIFSFLFFIPGGILAFWAIRQKAAAQLRALRIISAVSLSLTVVLLVISFVCSQASGWMALILNSLLILLSAPLLIAPFWAASLFLWACLLMATLPGVILPRNKKKK